MSATTITYEVWKFVYDTEWDKAAVVSHLDEALDTARRIAQNAKANTRVIRQTVTDTDRLTVMMRADIVEFRVTVSVEEVRFETAGDAQ